MTYYEAAIMIILALSQIFKRRILKRVPEEIFWTVSLGVCASGFLLIIIRMFA